LAGSIRRKVHSKFWRKGNVGLSRDCTNFWSTPYYLRKGLSYELQILYAHSQDQSQQKPIKNFVKNSRGRIQGLRKFSGHHNYVGRIFGTGQLSCCNIMFLQSPACHTIYVTPTLLPVKKRPRRLLSMSSPNIDRFLKFLCCCIQQKIYNKAVTKDPTAPRTCRYTTLAVVDFNKNSRYKQHNFPFSNKDLI